MTAPLDPPASPVQIRGYRAGYLRDLYRICLQTGDSGTDATGLFRDPELLGHVNAAPYGVLELHIDLLPRVQGRGIGRQLIELQLATLRDRGSHGVHFHVRPTNRRALSFYDHLGFTWLRTGHSHVLGMRLG